MAILFPHEECAPAERLHALRWQRLRRGLFLVARSNAFYRDIWRRAGVEMEEIAKPEDLALLPLVEKQDFIQDQRDKPPYGSNLSEPLENYLRFHQTTGTTGKPLRWLDTAETWQWRSRCAAMALAAAGVDNGDTVFFAFPFSPHSAFWGLFDGAQQLGALVISAGGWSTEQRIQALADNPVSVLACTPTYALHLAQEALRAGINPAELGIKSLVHAGEPGALVPHVRARLREAFGAQAFDYLGMTEVGAHGFLCERRKDALHLIASEFIAEVIDPSTGELLPEGEVGELVLTNLGRWACPAIRFRTGDLVRLRSGTCECGRTFPVLDGGVLGRRDQMVVIRGINVFPEMIGEVVGPLLSEGDEWQVVVANQGGQDHLKVVMEAGCGAQEAQDLAARAARECKLRLELTMEVEVVPPHTIERRGPKLKRLLDMRAS